MLTLPIRCPRCKALLGSWTVARASLTSIGSTPVSPIDGLIVEVTRARLRCDGCGRVEHFDGERLRRKRSQNAHE